MDEQTVAYGDTVTKPDDPTKDGQVFAGWYTEAGLTNAWDFTKDTVSEDMTLYAKWLEALTVIFETNNGSVVSDQTVADGDVITKPDDPNKDLYTFAGWYSNEELTNAWDFTTEISADTTLYADWEVAQGTVILTFTPTDSTTGLSSETITLTNGPSDNNGSGGWDNFYLDTSDLEDMPLIFVGYNDEDGDGTLDSAFLSANTPLIVNEGGIESEGGITDYTVFWPTIMNTGDSISEETSYDLEFILEDYYILNGNKEALYKIDDASSDIINITQSSHT